MRGVQCESCHGPGRAHAADPGKAHPSPGSDEAVCLRCHTQDQTQGRFVYAEYLPQVDHLP